VDVDLTSAGFAPGTLASGPFMSLPVLGGYLGEVEALGIIILAFPIVSLLIPA
jgi:hypothetical protein